MVIENSEADAATVGKSRKKVMPYRVSASPIRLITIGVIFYVVHTRQTQPTEESAAVR
jgi:hypothetical protein